MQPKSFEETYPRYEFSELVRLGIVCAGLLRKWLDRGRVPEMVEAEPPTDAPVIPNIS